MNFGKPIYDDVSNVPIFGGAPSRGVFVDNEKGRFHYRIQRATWGYRLPDDPAFWTMYESLYDIQNLLVSNYTSRSWWDSEWLKAESPSTPLGISFPTGAYNIALETDREYELIGFESALSLQPGEAYQLYTPNLMFETSIGGWMLSGNNVTLVGTGYSGGLSAFGTDLSGSIVDETGIAITTTGAAIDVSSISSGGIFYVLPTNPIIAPFPEVDGDTVFDYTKTLVDCSGLSAYGTM